MTATTKTEMRVERYNDGERLGTAKVNVKAYEAMAQWPQGLIEAGRILGATDRERLGVRPNETIYLTEL